MCWFSKMYPVLLRQVVEGEELVIREFKHSGYQGGVIGHKWFSTPGKTEEAVCLYDGCRLKLNNFGRLDKEITAESEPIVRFVQTLRDKPTLSFWEKLFLVKAKPGRVIARDVLIFNDGTLIPVARLPIGLRADVLSAYISGQDQVPDPPAQAGEYKTVVV